MFRQSILAVLAALTFSGCAAADTPQRGPVEIRLTRTICYGFCPDYTVTINGEGEVRYEGRAFVNVVGVRTATIPRQHVQRLLERFDEIGFDRLRAAYRDNITDLPTYTITLTRNGRAKSVEDYAGLGVGMPRAVRELQDEIDRVAGTSQWVLRDGQPVEGQPEP